MKQGTDMKRIGNGLYKFYVPGTGAGSSMDGLANVLIGLKEVREVIIADASKGYVVKMRFFAGMEPKGKAVERFVKRASKI